MQAQVNALQRLGRGSLVVALIAISRLHLRGNSVVDGSAINSGSVMTNLVDSKFVAVHPQLSLLLPVLKKTVQLLVPVKTGLEFKYQALIPSVKILEMSTFIILISIWRGYLKLMEI